MSFIINLQKNLKHRKTLLADAVPMDVSGMCATSTATSFGILPASIQDTNYGDSQCLETSFGLIESQTC